MKLYVNVFRLFSRSVFPRFLNQAFQRKFSGASGGAFFLFFKRAVLWDLRDPTGAWAGQGFSFFEAILWKRYS